MPNKETSKIKLEVDNKTVGGNYHDIKDAMQKAEDKLDEGAKKAVITEITTIKRIEKKK